MKPELNKKDQAKQVKLRKMLSLGQALSRLFGSSTEKSGTDKGSEEIPKFVTEGIIPSSKLGKKPKNKLKTGKGRSVAFNRGSEVVRETALDGDLRCVPDPKEGDQETVPEEEEETKESGNSNSKPFVPLMGVMVRPLFHHTVRKGDTLESIAKEYNTTADELKKLNELSDEQAARLKVGQKIVIGEDPVRG